MFRRDFRDTAQKRPAARRAGAVRRRASAGVLGRVVAFVGEVVGAPRETVDDRTGWRSRAGTSSEATGKFS